MRWISVFVLIAVSLAGCADSAPPPGEPPTGITPEVDDETAAICGVVVDAAIMPLEGALATINVAGDMQEQVSNAEGMFCFGNLPPGFHNVVVTMMGYLDESVQVEAVAGDANPGVITFKLTRMFDQDPYVDPFKFDGRLACHVQAGITAPCVTDWTQVIPQVCGNGCFEDLRTIMGDARDFIAGVNGGWQAHIVEMTWEQSSQATSSHMGLILRDFVVGGANHQYGAMEGTSPLWMQFDVGEIHPSQDGPGSEQIPADGYDQIIHFAGVRTAPGEFVAAAVEQEFTVFTNTFYYGLPPEGWSIVAGNERPF